MILIVRTSKNKSRSEFLAETFAQIFLVISPHIQLIDSLRKYWWICN